MNMDEVLLQIRPSADEARTMAADVQALTQAAQEALDALGIPGQASIQGSVAKDTWLGGNVDIDLFLLLDPALPAHSLEEAARRVGQQVLEAPRTRYAQHPYLVGGFRGRTVDLVPAYRLEHPSHRMSAVDRTPFHTAWVREHLDGAGRDQVRLVKKWMQGVEVYGAHTAVGGFSGYLVEVLVHLLGGFEALLNWLAAGAHPRTLAAGQNHVPDPEGSCLVVVDPVDPERNCAAAVREDTLERAVEAARVYQEDPRDAFFFPAPPRAEDAHALHEALQQQGTVWIGIRLTPRTDRLDIVFPQFQKAARRTAEALAQAGFPVRRHDTVPYDDEQHVGMQWVLEDITLPPRRIHVGPPAHSGRDARKFRKKWEGHPDAAAPVEEDAQGRLQVPLHVHHRTPRAWLQANLEAVLATGRHVREALQDRPPVLDDPGGVDPDWAPRVAETVLDRRPWRR